MSTSDGVSGSDQYLDQVTANIVRARQYLAEARQRSADWPLCSSALARALEHAVCAVFIAWDEPYKPGWKIHRHFDERLAPFIDPAEVLFVTALWKLEGSSGSDYTDQTIDTCRQIIGSFEHLAVNPPPAGWQPRPIPESVSWEGVHSRGAGNWRQLMAGSGGSQGSPVMALAMASSAVMPWAVAESR